MPEFIFYKEGGKITNPSVIRTVINGLQDGMYQVIIKLRKRRSLKQNAYYWLIVVQLAMEGLQDAGYREIRTPEDAHEVLKYLFLKRRIVNEDTGELIAELPGSTKKLTTIEMEDFMDRLRAWSVEYLNTYIPAPNEQANFFNNQ